MTPGRIDRHWAEFFGIAPEEFLRPGMQVVPHAGLSDYHGAWIFRRGPTLLISVPPERVAETTARARPIPLDEMQSEAAVGALFGAAAERVIGPAFQGTLEPEAFRPAPSPHVRRLTPEDRPAIQQLWAASDPIEWAHSNLTPDDPEAFGYFEGDLLVAACHNVMRAPDAADHGVLTHPGYRGRGHGKAVVSASVQYALEQGRLILYQTLVANTPAVGIALALGMREYARHVAVRLR